MESRKRACAIILGFFAISMGCVAAIGALHSIFGPAGEDGPAFPLLGIAGLPLLLVGALGLRRRTSSFYGAAAMGLLWLGCSTFALFEALRVESSRTVIAEGFRLILLSASGGALLFLALIGIAFDWQIRRMRQGADQA